MGAGQKWRNTDWMVQILVIRQTSSEDCNLCRAEIYFLVFVKLGSLRLKELHLVKFFLLYLTIVRDKIIKRELAMSLLL